MRIYHLSFLKDIILILLTFFAFNAYGQIVVKEGSFKQIEGYVMLDKNEHIDMNNAPMALIKISTENINNEDRRNFIFRGNLATCFDVHFGIGEIYLYVTASAVTFIEIIHEDFGKTEFVIPYELCDYCGYEMVVTRVVHESNLIAISSEPAEAKIYIDDVSMGVTPDILSNLPVGVHELKLEKEGYSPLVKEFEINKNDKIVLNLALQIKEVSNDIQGTMEITDDKVSPDSLQTNAHIAVVDISEDTLPEVRSVMITTDQREDEIYVDDVYVGLSPITIDLPQGIHTFVAKRGNLNEDKTIEITNDVKDYVVRLYFDNILFTVNGVNFCMIKVLGGTFDMGATVEQVEAVDNEYPVHSVSLDNYYIGETEVTQQLWEAVMGKNPSKYKNEKNPVENVSWYDCQKFITRLNAITGENFRLPTEAEWEYAARGGDKSQGFIYAGSNDVNEVAWSKNNSDKKQHDEVMKLQPNELGLYDMSGNVCEWCQDCFLSYDYLLNDMSDNDEVDEKDNYKYTYRDHQIRFVHDKSHDQDNADLMSSSKVLRGGCYNYFSNYCRVSYRFNRNPKDRYNYSGLRLAL